MMRALRGTGLALSALLTPALATLWVRSFSGSDCLRRSLSLPAPGATTTHSTGIQFTRGRAILFSGTDTYYHPQGANIDGKVFWSAFRLGEGHIDWDAADSQGWTQRWFFSLYQTGFSTSFSDSTSSNAAVALWIPTLFAALPLLLAAQRALRRSRRRPAGLCVQCGYDLRASAQRCPECGRAVEAGAPSSAA